MNFYQLRSYTEVIQILNTMDILNSLSCNANNHVRKKLKKHLKKNINRFKSNFLQGFKKYDNLFLLGYLYHIKQIKKHYDYLKSLEEKNYATLPCSDTLFLIANQNNKNASLFTQEIGRVVPLIETELRIVFKDYLYINHIDDKIIDRFFPKSSLLRVILNYEV